MKTQQVIWQVDVNEIDKMSDKRLNARLRLYNNLINMIERDKFTTLTAKQIHHIYLECQKYLLYELASFFFQYGLTKYKDKFSIYFSDLKTLRYTFKAS